MPFHTMWRTMEFYLQDKLVSGSDDNYLYKAYMEYITSTSEEEQITAGESMLFQKDSPGIFDNVKATDDKISNEGFEYKFHRFLNGAVVELIGMPRTDLFHVNKLILNGIPMRNYFPIVL